ncbi:MAG: hypothetical protein GY870_18250, partial [archaeon]|nr:hypothetical protein [archaeon]
ITRIPPVTLMKDATNRGLPGGLVDTYKSEVTNFFSQYRNNLEDNLHLLTILLDPPVYETITLLRQAIVTRDDLEKLQKKGVDDVDYVLKKLWEVKMISVLQDDSGNEYYGLQSDVTISKLFPEYNLNMIREQYSIKTKSSNVLVEYIDTLKDQFNVLRSTKKSKKSETEKAET